MARSIIISPTIIIQGMMRGHGFGWGLRPYHSIWSHTIPMYIKETPLVKACWYLMYAGENIGVANSTFTRFSSSPFSLSHCLDHGHPSPRTESCHSPLSPWSHLLLSHCLLSEKRTTKDHSQQLESHCQESSSEKEKERGS